MLVCVNGQTICVLQYRYGASSAIPLLQSRVMLNILEAAVKAQGWKYCRWVWAGGGWQGGGEGQGGGGAAKGSWQASGRPQTATQTSGEGHLE